MRYVYVLKSLKQRNRIYTGITADPNLRMIFHNDGKSRHTASGCPWEMVVCIRFQDDSLARDYERHLKTGSGRAYLRKRFVRC